VQFFPLPVLSSPVVYESPERVFGLRITLQTWKQTELLKKPGVTTIISHNIIGRHAPCKRVAFCINILPFNKFYVTRKTCVISSILDGNKLNWDIFQPNLVTKCTCYW